MAEAEFVNGLIVKPPRDGAPDFVKASISIKRVDLMEWLAARSDEWVNVDVKESKGGKWYAAVNTYKPNVTKTEEKKPMPRGAGGSGGNDFEDDIPF